ncbi:MAG: hypothetical protein HPY59_06235 [Anaerolineae bacterium]|nr:hypothetical protein [Anaerolineae bacterium]
MVKLQTSKTDQRAVRIPLTQKRFDYFASKENAGSTLLDTLFIRHTPTETDVMVTLLGHTLQNAETGLNGKV